MALAQREVNQALNLNRISKQLAGTMDQNVRLALQEQAKILADALQRHASVLQAAASKIPSQWVRVDKPSVIPSVDLSPILSCAERIQKALPQINYKGISSINLSTITQPTRNSIVAFSPYTGLACGINSQYTDNEEELSDGTTGNKSSVEHSRRCYNCQRLLGQDWIRVIHVILATIITARVIDIPSLLEEWEQRWWEPVSWVVMGLLSYWLTVRRTKQEYRK